MITNGLAALALALGLVGCSGGNSRSGTGGNAPFNPPFDNSKTDKPDPTDTATDTATTTDTTTDTSTDAGPPSDALPRGHGECDPDAKPQVDSNVQFKPDCQKVQLYEVGRFSLSLDGPTRQNRQGNLTLEWDGENNAMPELERVYTGNDRTADGAPFIRAYYNESYDNKPQGIYASPTGGSVKFKKISMDQGEDYEIEYEFTETISDQPVGLTFQGTLEGKMP